MEKRDTEISLFDDPHDAWEVLTLFQARDAQIVSSASKCDPHDEWCMGFQIGTDGS